jgi:hypothetical protein
MASGHPGVPAMLRAAEEGPSPGPIRFSVSYTLVDHAAIVQQHLAKLMRQHRLPFMTRMWVRLLAVPVFLFARHRMPACEFRIDGERIERVTARGSVSKRWNELMALRRYSHGYLLTFRKGSIPIPYRCLDGDQSRRLRVFAARRRTMDEH